MRQVTINFPEYNPHCFEVARNCRGYSIKYLSEKSGIKAKRISEIERGDSLPTEQEVTDLGIVLNYPVDFFRQIFNTTFSLNSIFPIPINYMRYRVVRDLNKKTPNAQPA